jgi:hypothetical protein
MSVKHRVSDHRARMRERGLRPVQLWLPDPRSAAFASAAHAQSAAVAAAGTADQDFVDDVSAVWDDEE